MHQAGMPHTNAKIMKSKRRGSQGPGHGIAGRLDAGREEEPELARQQVIGQGLPGGRVPQAHQVGSHAHIIRSRLPLCLHLRDRT